MKLDRMWRFQIFILIQSVHLDANLNLVEDFRQTCPYNDLCSVGKLLSLNTSSDYVPCCTDCFCDEYCKKFNDCCPDVEYGVVTSPGTRCTTTVVNNPRIQSVVGGIDNNLFPSFRMISNCPQRFVGSTLTVRMCAERFQGYPSSDDIVIVSNRYHHDEIYKNKHCASCNGVQETIRWNFHAVSCPNVWDGSTPFSELKELIWKSCILHSTPPEHLKFSRPLFDCGPQLISTCTDTKSTLRASCEIGPYAPLYVTSSPKTRMYRNPFCFLCQKENTPFSNICVNSSLPTKEKTTMGQLSMLLRINTQTPSTEKDSGEQKQCLETEIYDQIQDRCRTLSCPWNTVVFYGRCLKFSDSISNVAVPVKILFRPLNSGQTIGQIIRLDDVTQASVVSNLQKHFGFAGCEFQEARVVLYREKANDKQTALLIDLRPRISKACSFDFIVNTTRKVAAREYRMQLNKFVIVRDGELQMFGKVTFFQSSTILNPSVYDTEVLITKHYFWEIFSYVTEFYICPFLKLNLSEYNSLMINLGQKSETLAHINLTSVVYNGFYVLSDDVIAVCIDTYFDLYEKRGIYVVNGAPVRYSYFLKEYRFLTGTLFMFYCIVVEQIL